LIIDVRNNGGGSLENARTIVSRFTEEKKLVHNWQYKNGPGHDDLTEKIPKYIEPGGGKDRQYKGPVMILTNRSCFSATNFFVQMMKEVLPRGRLRVVGYQPGGGGGLPLNRELPNGWIYRFSSTVTTTPAGENIEGGIKPDVKVDMKPEDMAEGKDTILETALQIIRDAYN
jgi:C-terminal processing protease CtpA/Prc